MKVAIIYFRLLSGDGAEQLVGGVETYLVALGNVCQELGWEPLLIQAAIQPFEKRHGALRVVGIPVQHLPVQEQKIRLLAAATARIDPLSDILIFGADNCSVPTSHVRSISIQHGVSWDLPSRYLTQTSALTSGLGANLKKWLVSRAAVRNFDHVPNRVCVDYNFLNWYRTRCGESPVGRIWVIPNFAEALPNPNDAFEARAQKGTVDIIFARRFTEYRGARLFVEVVKDLLPVFNNVRFTIAGEGPLEDWMLSQLGTHGRVSFTKYHPRDSVAVHSAHDIAVVPSLGSEGTSLSVAEAMGAGCAVVASNVGGITNMVLDGYNGLLVMPKRSHFVSSIQRLLSDRDLRIGLGRRAWETADSAFGLKRWQAQWRDVLTEVARDA